MPTKHVRLYTFQNAKKDSSCQQQVVTSINVIHFWENVLLFFKVSSHLEVINSIRALAFSSCSTVTSTSLRSVGERWDTALTPAPRLILDDVELELRPESVIGDG